MRTLEIEMQTEATPAPGIELICELDEPTRQLKDALDEFTDAGVESIRALVDGLVGYRRKA